MSQDFDPKKDVEIFRENIRKTIEERKPKWMKIYQLYRPLIEAASKDGDRLVHVITPSPRPRYIKIPAVVKDCPEDLDGIKEFANASTSFWCGFAEYIPAVVKGMKVDIRQPKDQAHVPYQFVLTFQFEDPGCVCVDEPYSADNSDLECSDEKIEDGTESQTMNDE